MAKKSKKVNQIEKLDEQVQEETTEKTIEGESIMTTTDEESNVDSNIEKTIEELKHVPDVTVTVQEEIVKNLDENFGLVAEEEIKDVISEVLQVPEEKIEVIVKPKRPLESLSPAQLKTYQRTGFLPK